ncbi:acyl-CoA dehydrogenase [Nocardioides anomalus]|uniref:Acyl-CoA dehydrogenase n=1 Tax=Nocardioides anomalus TaxID=2712223 RepID=A0A6G6WBY1_9ACTN|nr:acyl-CoA dehydrogenase family protein [Nocardioides anomalus]QIG42838.1 acyl-CoA dehydrogenase [Nocardioides anomalus]
MSASVADSPVTLAEIAAEAEAFFAARVPRRTDGVVHGSGPDGVIGVGHHSAESEETELARAQAWQRELCDAGLAWVDGPVEYGGRGLSAEHAHTVAEVAAGFEVPITSCFMVSHQIVGPTILSHGTPEQKRAHLPGIWRGDTVCCQLFSEPEAGSDLAGLRTTARRDGDVWVVTGQKLWSSYAHVSRLGELIARTGEPGSRHRGLTVFLVDMDSPGIEVRPLKQITGGEHFNEVFLDEVRIPDSARVGPVDGGWAIAMTTVTNERSVLGREHNGIMLDPVRRLFALAVDRGAADDPAVQELLAECWAREQLLHETASRLAGQPRGPSVVKLMMTSDMEFYSEVAGRLLGYRMVADTGAWGTYAWSELLLNAPAHRIAGGSDEIQRNILAERVLGLPREARP